MPPVVLFALQALFLLLLYLFVARAVRAVVRDVRAPAPSTRQHTAPRPQPARQPRRQTSPAGAGSGGEAKRGGGRSRRGTQVSQLVVHHPDRKPQVVALDGAEIRIGRNETCDVVLSDGYASDRHARVYPREGGWLIADMGSTNGTYLNRERLHDPTPLAAGDAVTIGKTVLEVRK